MAQRSAGIMVENGAYAALGSGAEAPTEDSVLYAVPAEVEGSPGKSRPLLLAAPTAEALVLLGVLRCDTFPLRITPSTRVWVV